MNRMIDRKPTFLSSFLLILILLIVLLESNWCFAGSVFYITNTEEKSTDYQQLAVVCDFYGIRLEPLMVDNIEYARVNRDHKNEKEAFVIDSGAMQDPRVVRLIREKAEKGKRLPVLIAGLNAEIKVTSLRMWTEESVIGVREANLTGSKSHYKFANRKDLCRVLSGQNISAGSTDQKRVFWLEIAEKAEIERLICIENREGEKQYPVFVGYRKDRMELFLATRLHELTGINKRAYWELCETSKGVQGCFLESLPLFMFVRFVFGDECWHWVSHYANLTIDDPRLIEKYGDLDFEALLKEMDQSGFHTTIGFIPWNYDRNSKQVIDLFLKNQERFSIAVHGNSHDHREFGYYEKSLSTEKDKEIYRQQKRNIQQAVARMEEFKRLTGLSYDKVMIFPHGISPEPTLGILKDCGFLGTVNSGRFPWGSERRENAIERLRKVTASYEDLASFQRMVASSILTEENISTILIDLFLENPILLSCHSSFFNEGIGAFNETARFINRVQPGIRWGSLGEIVGHAYLVRKKEEESYEVVSFVDNFVLENGQEKRLSYHVSIPVSDISKVRDVQMNGSKISYGVSNGRIIFPVLIDPGGKKRVVVNYWSRVEAGEVNISRGGIRIFVLRWLSEIRDMYLGTGKWGSKFVKVYYDLGIFKYGLWPIGGILGVLVFIAGMGGYLIVRRGRRKGER